MSESSSVTVIITSYKEPMTIAKAIDQVVSPNDDMWDDLQLIVVAGDEKTLSVAQEKLESYGGFSNYMLLQDNANGKPAAINLAVSHAVGNVLILTDGDMHIDNNAIKKLLAHFQNSQDNGQPCPFPLGGVSGHPLSMDSRNSQFGYYGHLFCAAAHKKRLADNTTPMSGYLYAICNVDGLFPIPENIRAEDAYISAKLQEMGYQTKYEPNAKAFVRFPQNTEDWIVQKIRSLGGNVQIKHNRNVFEDLKMLFFPLSFARSPREILYSLALYPLRLYLWIKIYLQHSRKSYSKGTWQRIESTK